MPRSVPLTDEYACVLRSARKLHVREPPCICDDSSNERAGYKVSKPPRSRDQDPDAYHQH